MQRSSAPRCTRLRGWDPLRHGSPSSRARPRSPPPIVRFPRSARCRNRSLSSALLDLGHPAGNLGGCWLCVYGTEAYSLLWRAIDLRPSFSTKKPGANSSKKRPFAHGYVSATNAGIMTVEFILMLRIWACSGSFFIRIPVLATLPRLTFFLRILLLTTLP